MKGDEPAFPHTRVEAVYASPDGKVTSGGIWPESGLTKREWMATMILAGVCGGEIDPRISLTESVVSLADALIAELNKEKAP